jgi:hypothetical protein
MATRVNALVAGARKNLDLERERAVSPEENK